jgi:nicotinate-nucleotide pyrophosphorylase (carboxylating)
VSVARFEDDRARGPAVRPGPADPPRAAVREAVARALDEDLLPLGDLTASLLPADRTAACSIVVRQPGVISGTACAVETFAAVDDQIEIDWRLPDGSVVESGSIVATVSGPLRSVLTAERTALNFLGHLSGIATLTRRFVEAVLAVDERIRVLDTRKTTPGLRSLEKAAVRAGGGHNHRASLSDGVLVKDNHLGAVSITEVVHRARSAWPGRMVEVECDHLEQVREACRAGASAVLLDNMTPDEVARSVTVVRSGQHSSILVEVSGGVTLATVAAYAATGIDLISVGALTHSAPALDVGLDLDAARAG